MNKRKGMTTKRAMLNRVRRYQLNRRLLLVLEEGQKKQIREEWK